LAGTFSNGYQQAARTGGVSNKVIRFRDSLATYRGRVVMALKGLHAEDV
jgi:hypothetical protein